MVREVLETCVEAASFTSPMVCKNRKEEQVRQDKVQPVLPAGSRSAQCASWGRGVMGFPESPKRSGSSRSSSLGVTGSVSPPHAKLPHLTPALGPRPDLPPTPGRTSRAGREKPDGSQHFYNGYLKSELNSHSTSGINIYIRCSC